MTEKRVVDVSEASDGGWAVFEKEWDRTAHVIPVDDLFPHLHSSNCFCGPTVDDEGVVVHNAFDLREYFELDSTEC